jgi:hypothetical protein
VPAQYGVTLLYQNVRQKPPTEYSGNRPADFVRYANPLHFDWSAAQPFPNFLGHIGQSRMEARIPNLGL